MPAPPPPATPPPESPSSRFVLVGTSHAGNVGAAARAIKVMGFSDLVLVAPRWPDVTTRDDAVAMASGALDVLASARIVATLGEALDGITWAGATAMTPRDFGPPTFAPRDCFSGLATSQHRVAFIFGSERYGLSNDDLYTCNACLSIPTDPRYGSLNLAQAIQLVAYDWRQALGGFGVVARTDDGVLADAVAVRGLIAHWKGALTSLGFLDAKAPRKLVSRLHRLANRASLTVEEVQILRGIARAIDEHNR